MSETIILSPFYNCESWVCHIERRT